MKSFLVEQYKCYLLLDENAIQLFGEKSKFYIKNHYLTKYEYLYDFIEKNNLLDYYMILMETLISFKESCKTKKD